MYGGGGDDYLKAYMHSENLNVNSYCSFPQNCQNVETTKASLNK